jgi:hypothetical protein
VMNGITSYFWFKISTMAPILNTLPEDALFLVSQSTAERRYNYLADSEAPPMH